MERWQNCVAVVTGASSGIGATTVTQLIKQGLIVVGLARRRERIEALRISLPVSLQKNLHAIKCDVGNVNEVNAAFDWIEQELGGTDILVNNAGLHIDGQLLTMEVDKLQQVLQTNVMGVVHCTQRAFQSMQRRQVDGHVVLMNSILGHGVISVPPGVLPAINMYPLSKYALTALAEVLRQEFHAFGTKVKITSISPGFVKTDMVPEHLRSPHMLTSEDVANQVVYAISTPPDVQLHELIIKPMGEA